ncbi:unnamed protein product, partial [Iphiclides podalirius]
MRLFHSTIRTGEIDSGGTFTDTVAADGAGVVTHDTSRPIRRRLSGRAIGGGFVRRRLAADVSAQRGAYKKPSLIRLISSRSGELGLWEGLRTDASGLVRALIFRCADATFHAL